MQISLHSIRTDEFPALMYRPRGSVTLTITTVKFWTQISRRDHRIRSWRVNKKVMWRFHPQFELAQLWNDLDQTMEGNHKVSKKEKKKKEAILAVTTSMMKVNSSLPWNIHFNVKP